MTVGTISARTGIGKGTLFSEYARLSEILKPCTERLLELYRLAPVKGADETTWRCDGQNGGVYGFSHKARRPTDGHRTEGLRRITE